MLKTQPGLQTIISTGWWTSNSTPDTAYFSCKQYCNPTSENTSFVCTIFNCRLVINSENWAQYHKASTTPASKAKEYFVWCLWFQFYYYRGVSVCVSIIVCLFIVYEYACNFGIGFHFQKHLKSMPRDKQK